MSFFNRTRPYVHKYLNFSLKTRVRQVAHLHVLELSCFGLGASVYYHFLWSRDARKFLHDRASTSVLTGFYWVHEFFNRSSLLRREDKLAWSAEEEKAQDV